MKQWIELTPLLAPLAPALLLVGALFGGSQTPSSEQLLALAPRFQTTDSSELFFKNIRSVHYEKRDGPAEGFDLYHLRGLKDAPLEPFIVQHWLSDRAYVMYETDRGPARVTIDGRAVELKRELPEQAFASTMTLCAAFERGAEVLGPKGDNLAANRRHAKLFLRLCRDYLELVDLF